MGRFAASIRELNSSVIGYVGDDESVTIVKVTVSRDANGRIISSTPVSTEIIGYITSWKENEIDNKTILVTDKIAVLDAEDVEDKGIIIDESVQISFLGKQWRVISVDSGGLSEITRYKLHIRGN